MSGETRKVIEIRLKPNQNYVLEELAWLSVCHKILGLPEVAYVYHLEWFLDEFIEGKFGGVQKKNLGFLIIK